MKVEIIKDLFTSDEHKNLTIGSTHEVVEPGPGNIKNGDMGYVWVMGVDRKTILPPGSYEIILELE